MMVVQKDRVALEAWAVNAVQHQNAPNPTPLGSVIATAVILSDRRTGGSPCGREMGGLGRRSLAGAVLARIDCEEEGRRRNSLPPPFRRALRSGFS
jgi:hypothetical protein